jgi:hypothetical protein
MGLLSSLKRIFGGPKGPWDADREFPEQEHEVGVMDVRPDPHERRDLKFDPYLVAACQCGWVGEPRGALEAAVVDARGHSPWVRAKVVRPLA